MSCHAREGSCVLVNVGVANECGRVGRPCNGGGFAGGYFERWIIPLGGCSARDCSVGSGT
jgi:hypothetical protein